jgi:glucosamine--fructose-6-phosphate aminotransferase (isomerizing)
MSAPGQLMAAEVNEQPALLAALLRDGADPIAEVAARIRARAPRFALFAARGTSDHAALYAKYLAEIRLGLPAGLVSPSTTTIYGARPDLTGALFIAVSQSGASPDLVDSLTIARRGGALTVAVTNNPASALAMEAEFHIDVRAGVERAIAATKTYTAELLALYLLFASLAGDEDAAGLRRLPDAATATLAAADRATALAQEYRATARLIVTGRGYAYPTAREAALKLMETSYLSAHPFSAADLLHGPLAIVSSDVPVIAIVTPGIGGDAMAPVLERLAERGGRVTLVGPADGLPVITDGIEEALHPILQILPMQRFALELALLHGADPDRPRGLSKVTETW